ncbi:MAG: hypothetical protein LBH32_11865 [Dysgonamonadaceae bacterium]|jgi:hypothetical protein|nr:hypothetical protein [Dysgonamonadaceae bacterium]
MKKIIKTGMLILSISLTVLLWRCAKADEEFVHDINTISQMICKASHGGSDFNGEILEYDKNRNLVSGEFTQADVEGGYGVILFVIPETLKADVDLTNIYLKATVTYDEIITPSLSGRHDITGKEGMMITVKSGVGTTRQYRILGYYE